MDIYIPNQRTKLLNVYYTYIRQRISIRRTSNKRLLDGRVLLGFLMFKYAA